MNKMEWGSAMKIGPSPDHKRATHHASCTPQSRHQQIYFSVATLSAIIVDKCKPEVINKEHSALLLP